MFTITPQIKIQTVKSDTIYVGDTGNYSSIQEAINNAEEGDTIHIYSGIYFETVNITKNNLIIQGDGQENTIIDSSASSENSTILIDSKNNITLLDVKITNSNYNGIYCKNSDSVVIKNCEISNNKQNGINLFNTENIDIITNKIHSNDFDGLHIIGSISLTINNSETYDNLDSGILIYNSTSIDINNAEIFGNVYGVKIDDHSNNASIKYSNITKNDKGVLINSNCKDNIIYLNNFVDNDEYNALNNDENIWDNGTIGNYWDDYQGVDLNSDGIGDTKYTDNSVTDRCPLMHFYPSIVNQNTGEISLTIQNAIDDTDTISGHTIFVKKGFYSENIEINKDGITLLGEDEDYTIIDASNTNKNAILILNHNNITIKEFTIIGSPTSDIYNSNGVFIWSYNSGSENNVANNNIVDNCIIYDNDGYGVLIYAQNAGQQTNNNIVSNCQIFENGYSGIGINTYNEGGEYSSANCNKIQNCEIYYNGLNSDQDIETAGIAIPSAGEVKNMLVVDCIIYDSEGYDIYIENGEIITNNTFYKNNFLTNYDNVFDQGNNTWYNMDLQRGNYWLCYDEPSEGAYDNDSNGIIDKPYDIIGGSNQDDYPLALPNNLSIPVAVIKNSHYYAYTNETINFDASNSYDSDGFILYYIWDFGDGISDFGKKVKHEYSQAGTYTVTLTVEDDYKLKDTDTATATIAIEEEESEDDETNETLEENELPVVNAGGPYYEIEGVEIFFDGSDSYDPDGSIESWFWTFGDGARSELQTPTHTYSKEGNYTVTLKVTDNLGATNTTETFALITAKPNNPPGKPIIKGNTTGVVNISINFSANSSDIDGDLVQYVFNWSDGTNNKVSLFVNSSTEFYINHTWMIGGVYVITVYTLDENNATSEAQLYKVEINAYKCGSLGYLIDKNGNGTYDVFYRETTGIETLVEKKDGDYLIDINDDGEWDYTYNFTTNKLSQYGSLTTDNTGNFIIEAKWIILIMIIFAFSILIVSKIVIDKAEKNKKKAETKAKKIKSDKKSKRKKTSKTKKDGSEEIEKEIDKLLAKKKEMS
ncbi:MAG: hypothetical protein BV457_03145 [Thermoplasmata archaeon M9B1D]|nr:MAG: hypothetical protein BV457_03145 [Thermoplasmata archaeon M9B1D]